MVNKNKLAEVSDRKLKKLSNFKPRTKKYSSKKYIERKEKWRRKRRASSGLAGPDSALDSVIEVDENNNVTCQDDTVELIDLAHDEYFDSVVEFVDLAHDESSDSVIEITPPHSAVPNMTLEVTS